METYMPSFPGPQITIFPFSIFEYYGGFYWLAIEYNVRLPEEYDDNYVLTFADANQPKAKFGDILNFGDYRYINAYIVGKNNVLITNPDHSESGYLSIPLEITQYLSDATHKYSALEINGIDLHYDDDFLAKWFDLLPLVLKKFKFRWCQDNNCLFVTFPTRCAKNFTFLWLRSRDSLRLSRAP